MDPKPHPATMPVGHSTDRPQSEPQTKRRRLSQHDYGSISTRCADAESSLEVDHMILDYLAWKALDCCMEKSSIKDSSNCSAQVAMVDDFFSLFNARHPNYLMDQELRFRMLLLKFVGLYTCRLSRCDLTPSSTMLDELRANNMARALKWIETEARQPTLPYNTEPFSTSLPLPQSYVESRRFSTLQSFGLPTKGPAYDEAIYGTNSSVSLLDILPLFMQLVAARRALSDGNMGSQLINLAKDFMLKASLEQYLVRGASGTDAIDEAFSWGFKPNASTSADPQAPSEDDMQLNALFEDGDDSIEVSGWSSARDAAVALLFERVEDCPPSCDPLTLQLENLDRRFPDRELDRKLRDFLHQLSVSIDEPVLAQLEKGCLKDMSEAETQQFLRDCGLDGSRLFPRT